MHQIFALIVLIAIGAVIAQSLKKKKSNSKAWPVRKKELMNETEKMLFSRLQEALPNHTILAQVALSQMIEVRGGKDSLWRKIKFIERWRIS